jgi:D-alanine-D-alanine ligase
MALKKRRVLLLVHADLVPAEDVERMSEPDRLNMRTEIDVRAALRTLGHEVEVIGLSDDLKPLRQKIDEFKPHVAMNLLEEFHSNTMLDHNVIAYLELLKVPYTGCNPRGMILGRDKALSKKVVSYHRIGAPRFAVFRRGRKIKRPVRLDFPLIVKSLTEDASLGISEASVVRSDEKLVERVQFIHRTLETPAIVEQFIEGRELYVTVIGHERLRVLPPYELLFKDPRPDTPLIATRSAKWDERFIERRGVEVRPAQLGSNALQRITRASRRIYRALNLSGYARVDYRLDPEGKPFFLEANPNPDICRGSEAPGAAAAAGMSYEEFIDQILRLGLRSLG